jgi:polynucleotide 5'-hydroxyl-kinase GRC3/NOL9
MTARPGRITIPSEWSDLDLDALRGPLLVIGAPNSGKSTFAGWLHGELARAGRRVALLDGDVGQNELGPPTALTLAMPELFHWFVGDVSPRGRMLPLVVGAGRLARRALEAGAEAVVVDTTGLVQAIHGGVALKHALVDQLQPETLLALRRGDELEEILDPLRKLPRPRVIELPVCQAVRRRETPERQEHRARAFRRYFDGAGVVRLSLSKRAVFGGRAFAPRRLLALQDADSFALALGVVVAYDPAHDELDARAPLKDLRAVASVQLGAIGVDAATGRKVRPGRDQVSARARREDTMASPT